MAYFRRGKKNLWPNGRIPYVLSSSLTSSQVTQVQRAMKEWMKGCSIEFVERKRERDYVFITTLGRGCTSDLGRKGKKQFLKCPGLTAVDAIHELGHSIGLIHEHQRPNRGSKVKVHFKNIKESFHSEYQINDEGIAYGPYDQLSCMHYSAISATFSKDRSQPVMTAKDGRQIRQSGPTPLDYRGVDIAYGDFSGNLLMYKHDGFQEGTNNWAFDYGKPVGSGWKKFLHVTAPQTSENIFFGVETRGALRIYRHSGAATMRKKWVFENGVKVGTGWHRFRTVFAADQGALYAVESNGDLKWYKYHAGSNLNNFGGQRGKKVGSGWHVFSDIFASTNGVIYAVKKNGDLLWYKHLGRKDGENRWHPNSGARIGTGWKRFRLLTCSKNYIYGIEKNGALSWYEHLGFQNGQAEWKHQSAKRVGTGWEKFRHLLCTGKGRLYGVVN